MKKAQTSIEGIIAIILILSILVAVLSVISVKNSESFDIRNSLQNRLECIKLSSEIASVFSMGENATSSIRVLKDFNITQGVIEIGDYICTACCNATNGTSRNMTLSKGGIIINNTDTGVMITKRI